MIFYDVPGYEGLYKINDQGDVLSLPKKGINKLGEYNRPLSIMKPSLSAFGYPQVSLTKNGRPKHLPIHRLLCLVFKPNPNNYPCVNHIDGVKTNNSLDNLEWCSHLQNNIHAINNGLARRATGQNCHKAKLKDCDIPVIKKLYSDGISAGVIGKSFGVNHGSILAIVRGKTWRHL